jgi:N-acetylneuraminic acid mutarotase
MLVWGGTAGVLSGLNTGGRYNPTTDSWTPITTTGAPSARFLITPVWDGTEMLVWGGQAGTTFFANGGRYNPATSTWTPISTTGTPSGRKGHTAVWDGTQMDVWGGVNGSLTWFNDGGRYNPVSNLWTPISNTLSNTPTARQAQVGVWSGTEMIVWGGVNANGILNDGARYNPVVNLWTPMIGDGAPVARFGNPAVWTGSQMLMFGGYDGNSYYNDVYSYTPSYTEYIYMKQ